MRLRSYAVPAWAKKLIAQVCQEEGIVVPRVVWHKRKTAHSSGHAWAHNMTITAGVNRKEVKEVVLHELVHCIQGQSGLSNGRYHHGADFYAKLFAIGRRHRVGAQFIKNRENWYKPRGVKQGYSLYLAQLRATRT